LAGLFYNLGKKVGPRVRKARWMWQSIAGSEADAIAVEYQVGLDLSREVRRQLGGGRSPETTRMLAEVGQRLAARVANEARRFNFETVEAPEPNAFALPGGFIFVSRSLVELCGRDRDEVAFILGHEMAHVIRGHAMNRIVSNSAIAAASRVAPIRGVLSGWLSRVGVQFLESAYSRDIETEADKLGVRLVAAAGYNAQACVRLLSRLAELSSSAQPLELGGLIGGHLT
jgi:beta-barrel assembly-enhancing protease